MNLADLRKLSVRKNLRIRFPLSNGMECVVTEHGVARVPGLKGVPDFNLEQELASITQFVLEPANEDKKHPTSARAISRDELALLTASGVSTASARDEED
jgi:hypothetical protein